MTSLEGPVERTGERVRLREVTSDDGRLLDEWRGDPALMGEFNDFGTEATSVAEALDEGRRFVEEEMGRVVVERLEDGAVIGDMSWHPARYGPNEGSKALNMGISLHPDARGRGYGVEAQRLLAALLFDLFDVARVEASTDVENTAEQRALEKAGFTREGVLRQAQFRAGRHHDLVVYSRVRSDV
jgi:RimJ/RimL family protein N-acetyltransferase